VHTVHSPSELAWLLTCGHLSMASMMQQSPSTVDANLLGMLACPRDKLPVSEAGSILVCEGGHRYPVIDGVPVFLCAEEKQSLNLAYASLQAAETGIGGPFYLDTVGSLSKAEKNIIERDLCRGVPIDPVISWRLLATSGYAYSSLRGKVKSYPIPEIELHPTSHGDWLLDVGCNWGRWSLSAARKGWCVVGIDPSLGALLAARRMAAAEKRKIALVCGDARFMPFKAGVFDAVFSYSVLQHFDETEVEIILAEIARVLGSGGVSEIQMAHRYGLRSMCHRLRPINYAEVDSFRVRYWSWSKLQRVFEQRIGPSTVSPEAFGGLGLLYSDRKSVPFAVRIVITISEMLKRLTKLIPVLKYLADSVFIHSRKA
jgi:SAM-dependent methyltransferase/uncharacterized protein YbaR (Trm112 family)